MRARMSITAGQLAGFISESAHGNKCFEHDRDRLLVNQCNSGQHGKRRDESDSALRGGAGKREPW